MLPLYNECDKMSIHATGIIEIEITYNPTKGRYIRDELNNDPEALEILPLLMDVPPYISFLKVGGTKRYKLSGVEGTVSEGRPSKHIVYSLQ
jgi:hypothetical protein